MDHRILHKFVLCMVLIDDIKIVFDVIVEMISEYKSCRLHKYRKGFL